MLGGNRCPTFWEQRWTAMSRKVLDPLAPFGLGRLGCAGGPVGLCTFVLGGVLRAAPSPLRKWGLGRPPWAKQASLRGAPATVTTSVRNHEETHPHRRCWRGWVERCFRGSPGEARCKIRGACGEGFARRRARSKLRDTAAHFGPKVLRGLKRRASSRPTSPTGLKI